MSYEYKDYFKRLHIEESRKVGTNLNDRFNARDELNEVYTQAAKADEYEAKAKAFDRIVKESKGTFSCGDFCDDVRHIINNYEIRVATDD